MPSSKTYIVNDQATETDALDFTPRAADRTPRGHYPNGQYAVDRMTYNSRMATPTAFQVPPLNQRKRIPMKAIRAIAKHIAEKFDPEEIILFGSHAYGKPTAWSDVDLLVVMDTPKGEMDAILEVAESLPDLEFSVDILVRSRTVLEKRKKLGDWFLRRITKKGKVLYERIN